MGEVYGACRPERRSARRNRLDCFYFWPQRFVAGEVSGGRHGSATALAPLAASKDHGRSPRRRACLRRPRCKASPPASCWFFPCLPAACSRHSRMRPGLMLRATRCRLLRQRAPPSQPPPPCPKSAPIRWKNLPRSQHRPQPLQPMRNHRPRARIGRSCCRGISAKESLYSATTARPSREKATGAARHAARPDADP